MSRLSHRLIGSAAATAALLALAIPAAAAATPGAALGTDRAAGAAPAAAAGINDNFSGDACTSSSFCMAVGNYGSNGHAVGLAERLTGSGSWVVTAPVASPPHGWNVFANE